MMFVPATLTLIPPGTVAEATEDVRALWDPAPLVNETILPLTVTFEDPDGEVGEESPHAALSAPTSNNARTVR